MPNTIRIIVDTSQLKQLADGLTDAINSYGTRDLINKIIEKELLDSITRLFCGQAVQVRPVALGRHPLVQSG